MVFHAVDVETLKNHTGFSDMMVSEGVTLSSRNLDKNIYTYLLNYIDEYYQDKGFDLSGENYEQAKLFVRSDLYKSHITNTKEL